MAALSLLRLLSAALVAALAAGQTVAPSNVTLDTTTGIQLFLTNTPNPPTPGSFAISPLTGNAGQGQGSTFLAQLKVQGNLTAVNAQTQGVGTTDIAYISCDSGNSPGFIDSSTLVGNIGDADPSAILLYSLFSDGCTISNGTYGYTSIYSMTSSTDSNTLFGLLPQNTTLPATIAQSISSNGTNNDGGPGGGPPPTTAVAMSILYSITGLITLLFLIVIASGAVRAHRHPERYGPRAGVTGRPRQSRAKGLARAMLETLPIVKFGDPEPVKPGATDIELEDGTSSVDHQMPEVTGAAATTEAESQTKNPPAIVKSESGSEPATKAAEAEGSAEAAPKDVELGCSICTEDFTTGEDVRVLPCRHKYHPACIDPWLLNVSGTCPLCRHDLRPVQSPTPEAAEGAEGDELPPPLTTEEGASAENPIEATAADADTNNEASHRHRLRVSRLLDLTRLRTAPPEERIAALRQLREQSQQENAEVATPAAADQQSRSAGLSSRLRNTFHIRTRTQNAPES